MVLPAALAFLANPAFWSGAGKAAGSFMGAGGLKGLFGGGSDEDPIKTISTLSPEQQTMMTGLGDFLQTRTGKGLPEYEGAFTAPMTGVEQMGMGRLRDYVSGGGIGETAQLGMGAYKEALAGLDPKQVHEQYMKYTAPSEQRYLTETMIPTFKESMVPGGTLRSTGTERGIGDIISRYGEGQLGRIGERITSERAGARSMIPYAGEMSRLAGGVPQMEAAFQYGQLPRMIEQRELTAKLEEFKRTTPELSPIIDTMLNYLGVNTMAAYAPGEEGVSPFASLTGSLGNIMGKG